MTKDQHMKKTFSSTLMLLALGIAGQQHAQAFEVLGVASQYNVFLFGDLNLSVTDVEGRAAAGGNVTLNACVMPQRNAGSYSTR